ncbi:hypothetical protein BH18ACT16_BH18ACT16_01470 [soil metagenome]
MIRPSRFLGASSLVLVALMTPAAAAAQTIVKPYLRAVGSYYEVTPLLSVGDRLPLTGDEVQQYQLVGTPDGLGAHANDDGTVTLLMSHELAADRLTEPIVGAPLNRGSIVSQFILSPEGQVLSGKHAFGTVFSQNLPVGPTARTDNSTPAFGRFCSSTLAGPDEGLDRYIYFANEEADSGIVRGIPSTFDGRGGLTVAIFNGEAHTLPKLGRFAKENSVVMSGTGRRTVILSLEDGPSVGDSQLYMYVGAKDTSAGASVLRRNGLDNGRLYVLASAASESNNELSFQEGTTRAEWRAIPNADNMSDTQLELAADLAGAFGFVRIEDGAFSPTRPNEFFFATTGGNLIEGNGLGRLYSLRLNPRDPLGGARLHVVYNADQVIAQGGDIAISPDNIEVDGRHLMVQEGGTGRAEPVLALKQRELSVWRFDMTDSKFEDRIDAASATRVAEVAPPGRDGVSVPVGKWESSGVLDAGGLFGTDSWLLDVQAHAPTTAPSPNTFEDGQLLLLRGGTAP